MDIKEKTIEKLEGELKAFTFISIVLTIVILLLLCICIYGLLFKENRAVFLSLFVVGVSCGTMIPLQLSNIKKIKKELASRK